MNEPLSVTAEPLLMTASSAAVSGTSAGLQLVASDQLPLPSAQVRVWPNEVADVAIVTKGKRTLKTELCFGCGVVQVEIPGPPMRRQLSWMMNDKDALRSHVRNPREE